MNWTNSSVSLLDAIDAPALIRKVELAARNCYKSEDRIAEGSAEKLIRNCIKRGHESVLEHGTVSFRFICSRDVSHQLVRHRMASYSQESQRYCRYNTDDGVTFIVPYWAEEYVDKINNAVEDLKLLLSGENLEAFWLLVDSCEAAEDAYIKMLEAGLKPEEARSILPNCTKTDIVCTMNIREIRHFIKLRSSAGAQPDIRSLAIKLRDLLIREGLGVFFEDLVDDKEA